MLFHPSNALWNLEYTISDLILKRFCLRHSLDTIFGVRDGISVMTNVPCLYLTQYILVATRGLFQYKRLHKSHNAPVPYPTMHHFVTEMNAL